MVEPPIRESKGLCPLNRSWEGGSTPLEEPAEASERFPAHTIGSARPLLDSLQTEEYDDSSYVPLGTLRNPDRQNRAMASVFSYYVACFHYSSNRDDHLIYWPRAGYCFSPSTPDYLRLQFDGRTDPPAYIYECEATYPQRTTPLHGSAANDAAVSTRKPRRLL
jgi:hypothetical protein